MPNNQQKFNKFGYRLSFPFFILAVILAITFFLVLADYFRSYRSEITILFIPKSEAASFQSFSIVENLIRFPGFLSFYEKMLGENKNLKDEFAGFSKDSKKKMWNRALDIKKDDGSTMMKIGITLNNRDNSNLFARQTARTLFDTASFYYNIKTDADFRIIDGPVTAPVIRYWYWLALLSVSLGLAASLVLNILFSFFFRLISKAKVGINLKQRKKEAGIEPISKAAALKRHQAPANLPIAPEGDLTAPEDLSQVSPAVEGTAAEIYKELEPRELSEPTEEELKRRLNQLLRGEL